MNLSSARSFLFVPASRPERLAKALASAAGGVIVDLEDAVSPAEKPGARAQLVEALAALDATQRGRVLVRINAPGTEWHVPDLSAIAPWCAQGLCGAMVPKAESAQDLHAVASALGPAAALVPLVESLAGLDALPQIAGARQVRRLAFGHIDFQLDLGLRCTPDEPELAAVRFQIVAASRRATLAAPIDGVTVALSDGEATKRDAVRARAAGFGAKLCIHPSQVDTVNAVFAPTEEEVAWAQRVLVAAQASGGAAIQVDGKMIDLPVIRLAQQTLGQAPHRSA
ncbi:HpcH/HpaI aldolase/citrate lyase family protein [Hydrogenophaga sp. BPS33]|uniref:HpcH/HpaI aldolase/citrate lyase family protein n=1 Tax=Hydrogenophaga sp. BPS33 TaxID=2651974 RepID=UPI0013202609|nr:CoA ester lyase [Hydrogenophaga sp. BPS33]QHE87851.1 CoA ester lyase [Hydrogenophaga sp. BPS33]